MKFFIKKISLAVVFLIVCLEASGCRLTKWEDYYEESEQDVQEQTQNKVELRKLPCNAVQLGDAILLDEYGKTGIAHENGNNNPFLYVTISDVLISDDINDYFKLNDTNPDFMDWLCSMCGDKSSIEYDADNNKFTIPIAGVGVKIYMICMDICNPLDEDVTIRSNFDLYERDVSDNSVKQLNIINQSFFDRPPDGQDYTIGSGETFHTIYICIQPEKRILTYTWIQEQGKTRMYVEDMEDINSDQVYLRLSLTGSVKIRENEYFCKIQ